MAATRLDSPLGRPVQLGWTAELALQQSCLAVISRQAPFLSVAGEALWRAAIPTADYGP